jgi:aspartate kinase
MKVFKFGGASVGNVESIKNVCNIISEYSGQPLIVVVSAMGKTTNALEKLADAFFKGEPTPQLFEGIRQYHYQIITELFGDDLATAERTIKFIDKLSDYLQREPSENFDYEYDQIVSFGELISTSLLSEYLVHVGISNHWADARHIIRTDNHYREGNVNWEKTEQRIKKHINPEHISVIITQGFIAGTDEYTTTTLGREGSDYSAAIFGYSLNAENVTIWKDVPGLLNADPKYFPDAVKLDRISYKEAIELAYYGATIIHPKTIKPLQNKSIPLCVKSFYDFKAPGSIIGNDSNSNHTPCYIFKRNQALISIYPIDFSFIAEENLSLIFGLFAHFGVKINLMQNSAISFSVCVDYKPEALKGLIEELDTEFKVKYNLDLELITVRNYDQQTIDKVVKGRKILTEQKSRSTIQLVVEA